jgi:hypothetical protein
VSQGGGPLLAYQYVADIQCPDGSWQWFSGNGDLTGDTRTYGAPGSTQIVTSNYADLTFNGGGTCGSDFVNWTLNAKIEAYTLDPWTGTHVDNSGWRTTELKFDGVGQATATATTTDRLTGTTRSATTRGATTPGNGVDLIGTALHTSNTTVYPDSTNAFIAVLAGDQDPPPVSVR